MSHEAQQFRTSGTSPIAVASCTSATPSWGDAGLFVNLRVGLAVVVSRSFDARSLPVYGTWASTCLATAGIPPRRGPIHYKRWPLPLIHSLGEHGQRERWRSAAQAAPFTGMIGTWRGCRPVVANPA